MTQPSDAVPPDLLTGRLLSYTNAQYAAEVEAITRAHPRSGLVVRGTDGVAAVRRCRLGGSTQFMIVDHGVWASKNATDTEPFDLPADDGLFSVALDDWADAITRQGADVVLTPSRFVQAADWAALRSVLRAGQATSRSDVRTLVATDAAMLDPENLSCFQRSLSDRAGHDRLAFVFAGKQEPLAKRNRAAGLRALVDQYPDSLVIGVDVLAGTDVFARGAAAAIGVIGSMRRPNRPGDDGRPPAKGFVPGLFMRDLWESRSPNVYSDWYANSPSPTCGDCGGRAVDNFTDHPVDKDQIRRHNVHAWLAVLAEIARRRPDAARDWLVAERLRAFTAHAELRPTRGSLSADRLLRVLCELDDPQQRRTTPTGQWH